MSQPSVSRCIREVIKCINKKLSDKYVQFPTTEVQRNRMKDWFRANFKIPNVIGCIDRTQIGIYPPAAVNREYREHLYVNREGKHAINAQIIVDHEYRVLNLNARFPGSTHDSHIWRSSGIRPHLSSVYGDNHEWLLGDSGYPLEPWLLTPYNNPQNNNEEMFNASFTKARSTVERAIGLLKGRWRCLCKERMLHYTPETCTDIINACSVLHNICVKARDNLPPDELVINEEDGAAAVIFPGAAAALQAMGNENRREVIHYMRTH